MLPSAFYLCFTLSRLLFAWLAARGLGAGHALAGCVATLCGAGVAMALSAARAATPLPLLLSVGALGAGLGPLFALALGYPAHAPLRLVMGAAAVAVCVTTSNAGELLVPLAVSVAWGAMGARAYVAVTLTLCGATAAAAALLWLLTRNPAGRVT